MKLSKQEATRKIAKSLKYFLENKKMTAAELADSSGVQASIIEDLLAGDKSTPAISDWYILYQLSKPLECLVNELIEGPAKSLPEIKNQADLDNYIWRRLDPSKYNILIPRYVTFGQYIKMIIHIIQLDPTLPPNPDKNAKNKYLSRGKHFWVKKGRYVLTYNAILTLAHAAGIDWGKSPGIVASHYGIDNTPLIMRYQAYGERLNHFGFKVGEPGTYEWNHAIDQESTKYKDEVVAERQQYAAGHAETGAMSRAFYRLLGFPEKSFSKEDAGKPFVVSEFVWDFPADDPEVKKRILDQAFSARGSLFGSSSEIAPAKAEMTFEKPEPPKNPPKAKSTDSAPASGSDKLPTREEYEQKWIKATPQQRGKQILELCGLIKENPARFVSPDKMAQGAQIYHIMRMAEKAGQFRKEKQGVRS